VPTTDTPLTVHFPQGTARGGVVVVQEAYGVNAHIDDVCRRFAAEGWLAVAPHLYHRSGDPTFGYDDVSVVRPYMAELTPASVIADMDAAIAHLDGEGIAAGEVGVVGFCMGGSIALIAAAERDVGAAVTFYGGGISAGRFGFAPLIELAPHLKAPWLGLYGDLDHSVTVEDVERLRKAAATASVPTDVVRYADAGHGFHCDERRDFHPQAARDAWARALAWLDDHTGSLSG
jgi:carboxymethylenebutenolidase